MKKAIIAFAAVVIVLFIGLWMLWVCYPCSDAEIASTDTRVVVHSRYVLLSDGKPLFSFTGTRGDTLISGFVTPCSAVDAEESQVAGYVTDTVNAQWVKRWRLLPYCGETAEIQPVDTDAVVKMSHEALLKFLSNEKARIGDLQETMAGYQGDVAYYLKTHSVIDNGFDIVQRYSLQLKRTRASLITEYKLLDDALKLKNLSVKYERTYTLIDDAPRFSRVGMETARRRLSVRQTTCPVLRQSHIDSLGIYEGQRDSVALPHGYGRFIALDGGFYEGEWLHGEYDGVGFFMTPGKRLRMGEWKKSHFLGERVTYTPNRIYGIDISRYQHEKGRRRFSINWKNLRIKSLGHASRKDIAGVVDYPVSFVYIKATEGISVKNKYFVSDYVWSRKTGHRTGAYHFYITRVPGRNQAINFIRNARYHKGDLPPVLDLEPTEAQVRKLGVHQLFINVQTWLNTVERYWGVRPVLYISQKFVNRHLGAAPYIKEHYNVWIARYGEYKPDINLLYWQLCQDGRVSGIAVPVDINVLNGFQLP